MNKCIDTSIISPLRSRKHYCEILRPQVHTKITICLQLERLWSLNNVKY